MTSESNLTAYHRVPVIHAVDVLVVGAGSGAVAAALEARSAGASVLAVSDRSYFGDESAGALRLDWPGGGGDPLLDVFETGAAHPPCPGAVKRRLEGALLEAGIPLLFYARPVSVLRDGAGQLRGVVLASRTSLYAVTCSAVVDATRHGLVAQLLRLPLDQQRAAAAQLDWVVLSPDAPADRGAGMRSAGRDFVIQAGDGPAVKTPAHLLSIPRPEHENSVAGRAGMEHRVRAGLSHPTLWGTAETIADHATAHLPTVGGAMADEPLSLSVEACQPRPDLLILSGLLPLSLKGIAALEDPRVQVALGRRVGRRASEIARANAAATGRAVDWDSITVDAGGDEAEGAFGFAGSFVRGGAGLPEVELAITRAPLLGEFDVVVAGGGTGGAPAGIAAARAGARTAVLEMQRGLGGVGTVGLIASYWLGNRVGFTTEIDRRVAEMAGDEAPQNRGRWNPHLKDLCLQRALLEAGGAAWLGSFAFGVQREGGRVAGLLVSTPFGSGLVRTGAVVDATGSADVAAAAGAPCRVIDHHHVAVQGTGLAPQKPGAHYCNTDHSFVDDTDVAGVTHAFVTTRAKFKRAFDVSPLVDSRERRQIRGAFELSPLDLLAGRTFPDTITTAKSNFDTHGFTVHPVFIAAPPDKTPITAHVPFRCMLPEGVQNVLVTGLGMSAHRDALPVVRMQADVQNQGYAAGLAAARSAATGTPLRELEIRALQRQLVELGILEPAVLEHEDSFPLSERVLADALASDFADYFDVAVLLAHADRAVEGLRGVLRSGSDARREQAALLLGLMGQAEAAPVLIEAVEREPWDEGWNFTGMGQFGRSMSRLDALIIALGQTGDPAAVAVIEAKARALGSSAAFSHCRAISMAAAALGAPPLSDALAKLLRLPGVRGHAQLDTREAVAGANDDPVETEARNLSLRELVLARGLYLCGDVDGLGREILITYTRDLRGHYARHAQALLAAGATTVES